MESVDASLVLTNASEDASQGDTEVILGLDVSQSIAHVAIGEVDGFVEGDSKPMSKAFDYSEFNHRMAMIIAGISRSSFDNQILLIDELQRDYGNLDDEEAQRYVALAIDDLALRTFIGTCQPFPAVCQRYWRNVDRGFNGSWPDVYSTTEYADYCCKAKQFSEGLRALQDARERLTITPESLSNGLKKHLFREIDSCVQRLRKRAARQQDNPSE